MRVGAFLIVQPRGVLAGIWVLGYIIAMVQWVRSVVVQRLSPAMVFRHGMEVFEMLCVFCRRVWVHAPIQRVGWSV